MNKNNVWLNFAVKDLRKTREFYAQLDHFKINTDCPDGADLVSIVVGDDSLIVNFFPEAAFKGFINHPLTDATQATETCLSLGALSEEEVDARLQQAVDAGATVFSPAAHMGGWMYGAGFADPDGHRWNLLYMDESK